MRCVAIVSTLLVSCFWADDSVVADMRHLTKPWQHPTIFGGVLKGQKVVKGCHMPGAFRHVEDGFISEHDISLLVTMAKKGMSTRPETAGPSILDINSGFLKDGGGISNIFEGPNAIDFSQDEYRVYGEMFDKIKQRIMEVNGLSTLYFTAPTFVARTVGDLDWKPQDDHDEYWNSHVDKENTFHYDYSGLVYLSDYGIDFEGGEFQFLDLDSTSIVLPRRGRFITFASGRENRHKFSKVSKGARFVFSMWFTCDSKHRFKKFLDGKVHNTFDQQEEKIEL